MSGVAELQHDLDKIESALEKKVNARADLGKTIAKKRKRSPEDSKRDRELKTEIESLVKQHDALDKRIVELKKNEDEKTNALKDARRKSLLADYTPQAFDGCPVSHVVFLTLTDWREHGIVFVIISGDRRDGVAQKFGHSSQAQCYYGYQNGDPNYPNPANPPGHSTHEYRRGANGYPFPPGADGSLIDASKLGLDFRSNEEAIATAAKVKEIGYDLWLPYNTGSELHHGVIRSNPVPNLIKRGRV